MRNEPINLYVSRKAAWRVAIKALARGVADQYAITFRFRRADDRSLDRGYAVALHKAGRFVGFA